MSADVAQDDLRALFADADVVIHLAWLIQPSRDGAALERVNVHASRRVFEAAAEAGVARLVHASSVGVYSPGPKDRAVDESWPREGVASSFYSVTRPRPSTRWTRWRRPPQANGSCGCVPA
jgi:UDP-glucose 4-epimerase